MISINTLERELKGIYGDDFIDLIDFYIQEVCNKLGYGATIKQVVGDFSKGCSTGVVDGLIYYSDTSAFFEKYVDQISATLSEYLNDCGCTIVEMFGDTWDDTDMFCRYESNQNLMSWYMFEHINDTAVMICEDNE
jgi:hypothetical protein